MSKTTVALRAGTVMLSLSGGAALAQEACQSYLVKAGDNLRSIARVAYGDGDMYRLVFDANSVVIGPEADLIKVGSVLTLPCNPNAPAAAPVLAAVEALLDAPDTDLVASAPAGVAIVAPLVDPAPTPEVITPASAAAPQAAAGQKPIGFVTGNGYAPFTDEMLPGGGMVTQLVEMAVFRANPAQPYTLTFINDWQAHLDALLPSRAYDMSFPWTRPNCEEPMTLTAGDLSRCETLIFSDPLYEIVEGLFVTADSGLADVTRYEDLFGKRICRPEGSTMGMLDSAGLAASATDMMRPVSAAECFAALKQGKTDVVALDADVADAALAALGMTQDIVQNPHLTAVQTLHVIAYKANPDAAAMIAMLNEGITEMYQSGEWYDIVSTALARAPVQQ